MAMFIIERVSRNPFLNLQTSPNCRKVQGNQIKINPLQNSNNNLIPITMNHYKLINFKIINWMRNKFTRVENKNNRYVLRKTTFRHTCIPKTPEECKKYQPLKQERIQYLLATSIDFNNAHLRSFQFQKSTCLKQKKIANQLNDSFEIEWKDKQRHQSLETTYYSKYKQLKKIIQQNKFRNCSNSTHTNMLQTINHKKILPIKLGLINKSNKLKKINLQNYKMGDKYASVFSTGISALDQIDQLNLSKNRFTNQGGIQILKNLHQKVKVLNLANNFLTKIEDCVIQICGKRGSLLRSLDLSNNRLGDKGVKPLLKSLIQNQSIEYLNLANNNLTKKTGILFQHVLKQDSVLRQLNLRWVKQDNKNNIGSGSSGIFEGLLINKNLNILDLSYNCIDNNKPEQFYQFLNLNKTLFHLDLSHNNYTYGQCVQISTILMNNHTIYGLHFQGNYGYIDHLGFLIIEGQNRSRWDIDRKIGDTVKGPINRCWVCQNWSQLTLYLPQQASYQIQIKDLGILNTPPFTHMLPSCSYILKDKAINKEYYFQFKSQRIQWLHWQGIKPRLKLQQLILQQKKQVNSWCFQRSIWSKQSPKQDKFHAIKCFQKDWQMSKCNKLIKAQEKNQVKQILRNNYKHIRQIYKELSSYSPFADVWAIKQNVFLEFCRDLAKITELPSKIIDLVFITTCSSTAAHFKGNPRNPERGLVRFQFLQALVRLAQQKFVKTSSNLDPRQRTILFGNLSPLYPLFNPQQFRQKEYFIMENDILITKYKNALDFIYKKNSKLKVKPGEKSFMCLEQFKNIFVRCGIFSRFQIKQRQAFINFRRAMANQIEQLQSDRIFRMSWIQFVQAISRMANSINPLQKQQKSPIYLNLQWLIVKLIEIQCSQQLKKQYPSLGMSIFR